MISTELIPNLYWNCNPSTNKNILILCHPQLVNYYIQQLKDKIWKFHGGVTIWHTQTEVRNSEKLLNEIKKMDLVIVLVSEMFMFGQHVIRDIVLPYAISEKLTLLPIVLSNEVEAKFDEHYGHIHFVKSLDDIESIATIINDYTPSVKKKENIQASYIDMQCTKNPFSQTYFVSYRKKDGQYIDFLQKKVHENYALIDTQLWYDTYLVPGENYDERLIRMMDSCDAVILLVTAQLLEPDNYVLRKEMPYAMASGKRIVAIQVEECDLESIKQVYKIQDIYRLDEWDCFSDLLSVAGISVPKVSMTAQHIYSIGKEYLDGSVAEKNHKLAVSLLHKASELGYIRAYETLIEVFSGNYKDFSVDYDKTISLLKSYINILSEKYFWQKNKIFAYMRKLGDFYYENNEFNEAYCQYQLCYKYIKEINQNESIELTKCLSVSCLNIARTLNELGEIEKAEMYYRKTIDLDMRMYNDVGDDSHSLVNLLVSLSQTGEFYQQRGFYLKAKIMYDEVITTIHNSNCIYGVPWDADNVYDGYEDEYAAQNIEEINRFVECSLAEIHLLFQEEGIYHPQLKLFPREYLTHVQIFEQSEDAKIPLMVHEIILNTMDKIKWLVAFLEKYDIDFYLRQNKYCVDAKSLMGIMSLDVLNSFELIIHADIKKADTIMKEIVMRLNSNP